MSPYPPLTATTTANTAVPIANDTNDAWWFVKDRVRIGQGQLQNTVASKTGGTQATCVKTDTNAAHWLCVVAATGTPARCFRAHVRPWGSVDVVTGYRQCLEDPAL